MVLFGGSAWGEGRMGAMDLLVSEQSFPDGDPRTRQSSCGEHKSKILVVDRTSSLFHRHGGSS
jgi:hypothetical protein